LARLQSGISEARAKFAGRWEDPVFKIDVLHITESVDDPWTISPGLALTIPLSGKLAAEKSTASALHQVELARIRETEWNVRHQLRKIWVDWSAVRLRLEESRKLLERMDDLVESTRELAEAGEMIGTEAALFPIERNQQRILVRQYQMDAREKEQELRALMGLTPDADVELSPNLNPKATVESSTPAKALVERNPTIARLRQEYAVAEKQLQEEIRKQKADMAFGPIAEIDQGQDRVGATTAISIPVFNRNQQAIATAQAGREHARVVVETAFERHVGTLTQTRTRLKALKEQREELEQELAPLVEKQFADSFNLLKLGEGSGLVLLESLVRAHQTKMQLIDIKLNHAFARIKLAYLTGPEPAELHDADESVEELENP
jgi:outer membrane protein TolC